MYLLSEGKRRYEQSLNFGKLYLGIEAHKCLVNFEVTNKAHPLKMDYYSPTSSGCKARGKNKLRTACSNRKEPPTARALRYTLHTRVSFKLTAQRHARTYKNEGYQRLTQRQISSINQLKHFNCLHAALPKVIGHTNG